MTNEKRNIMLVLAAFLLWVLISVFWYTCGLKGFCQNDIAVKTTADKGEYISERIMPSEDYEEYEEEYLFDDNAPDVFIGINNEEQEVVEVTNTEFQKRTISCMTHINSTIKLNKNNIASEVMKLESFLNDYYDADLAENGVYDAADKEQVIAFQTLKNLEADGVVGPKTLQIINAVYCVKNEKN